jgi:hypothetical protein
MAIVITQEGSVLVGLVLGLHHRDFYTLGVPIEWPDSQGAKMSPSKQ